MKVNQFDVKKSVNINSKDIQIGTVFSGQISGYEPTVFLRSFDCVIDLENPHDQWNHYPDIKNYVELEAELTVRGKV